MKVGIRKHQENEWVIQIGCASVKLDRFSLELLNITLEHLVALGSGQQHSTLMSYERLAQHKLKSLDAAGLQKWVHSVENADLLVLMQALKNQEVNDLILTNVGGILARQLSSDLLKTVEPTEERAKEAIKKTMERLFDLEMRGQIQFFSNDTQYI